MYNNWYDNPLYTLGSIFGVIIAVMLSVILVWNWLEPLFNIRSRRLQGQADLGYWENGGADALRHKAYAEAQACVSQAVGSRQSQVIEAGTNLDTAWTVAKSDLIRSTYEFALLAAGVLAVTWVLRKRR